MHIKKSLMDMLELPLALRHGILGRLEIQIPWSTLNKDPILVAVERVRKREKEREREKGQGSNLEHVYRSISVDAGQSSVEQHTPCIFMCVNTPNTLPP